MTRIKRGPKRAPKQPMPRSSATTATIATTPASTMPPPRKGSYLENLPNLVLELLLKHVRDYDDRPRRCNARDLDVGTIATDYWDDLARYWLVLPPRTATRQRALGGAAPLPASSKWSLFRVAPRNVHHYHVSGKEGLVLDRFAPIPPQCRHLTVGPAKGVESDLPEMSHTVETLALEHVRPRRDGNFISFWNSIPWACRLLTVTDSGDEGRDDLFAELIKDPCLLHPTLVELKILSWHNYLGETTMDALTIALPRQTNLQVFHLGRCTAIGVDRVVAALPRTGMRELVLHLHMDVEEEQEALERLAAEPDEDMEVEDPDDGDDNAEEGIDSPLTELPGYRVPGALPMNLPAARRLKLQFPMIDSRLVELLKLDRKTEHFALAQDARGGWFLSVLAHKLPPSLLTLDLSSAGPFGAEELAELLFPCMPRTLEKLMLRRNRLQGAHIEDFMEFTNLWPPNLYHLDLRENYIQWIPTPLPRKLRYFGIACNPVPNGCIDMAWVRALPQSMQEIELDREQKDALVKAILAHPPRRRNTWRLKLELAMLGWPKDAKTARLREFVDPVDGNTNRE
ncbi:hypothetical protein GGF32_006124 [Allomyces javanicus]|nr:hypothetical protein GGF32_006124 [Allomyces javanicus]